MEALPNLKGSASTEVSGSRELCQVLVNTEEESVLIKDSFISVEHLLMVLVDEGKGNTGRFLADQSIIKERIRKTQKEPSRLWRNMDRILPSKFKRMNLIR